MSYQQEQKDDTVKHQPTIHIRMKVGLVNINDIAQQYRPDVNVFFYFKPIDGASSLQESSTKGKSSNKFEVIKEMDGFWRPKFDFLNEVDEPLVTDESYWINRQDGTVFGRVNMIPTLQKRMNHTAFPYDRQILDVELLSNNCLFKNWERSNDCPREIKLNVDKWHIQGELASLADAWDLNRIRLKIEDDEVELSSKASILLYIQREHEYYTFNISITLFLIIILQNWLPNFPYTSSRYNFALTLVLTLVAFRFVIQNLIPLTSYLKCIEKYMLVAFILLVFRFITDFLLILIHDMPSDPDFEHCGAEIFTFFGGDHSNLPLICVRDLQMTIFLTILWISSTIVFLIPQIWRQRWESIEKSLVEEKLLETTFWEDGKMVNTKKETELTLSEWLHKHGGIHNEELERLPSGKNGLDSSSRNCREVRGWTLPQHQNNSDANNFPIVTKSDLNNESKNGVECAQNYQQNGSMISFDA